MYSAIGGGTIDSRLLLPKVLEHDKDGEQALWEMRKGEGMTPEQLLGKLHEIDILRSAYPYEQREEIKLRIVLKAIEDGEVAECCDFDGCESASLKPDFSKFLKEGV